MNLDIVEFFGKKYIWLFNQDGDLYLSKISDNGSSWEMPSTVLYDIKYTKDIEKDMNRVEQVSLKDLLRISYLALSGETWTRESRGSGTR